MLCGDVCRRMYAQALRSNRRFGVSLLCAEASQFCTPLTVSFSDRKITRVNAIFLNSWQRRNAPYFPLRAIKTFPIFAISLLADRVALAPRRNLVSQRDADQLVKTNLFRLGKLFHLTGERIGHFCLDRPHTFFLCLARNSVSVTKMSDG